MPTMIRMRTVLQNNSKTFILQDTQMYSAKPLSPLEVFHWHLGIQGYNFVKKKVKDNTPIFSHL